MKFIIRELSFGNAISYTIDSEDGKHHYHGPFLAQLKSIVRSQHSKMDIKLGKRADDTTDKGANDDGSVVFVEERAQNLCKIL